MEVALSIDPKEIESLAHRYESANQSFAKFLKTQDPEEIDRIVLKTYKAVSAKIDCTMCGKCCRALVVGPASADVAILAAHTRMTTSDFKRKYMRVDDEGDLVFRQRPCPFLRASSCSVYESRPVLCRKYPYLDQGDFVRTINRVLRNIPICPIVFHTYESLKHHFAQSSSERCDSSSSI